MHAQSSDQANARWHYNLIGSQWSHVPSADYGQCHSKAITHLAYPLQAQCSPDCIQLFICSVSASVCLLWQLRCKPMMATFLLGARPVLRCLHVDLDSHTSLATQWESPCRRGCNGLRTVLRLPASYQSTECSCGRDPAHVLMSSHV